jgi:hypothetical protein
VVVTRRVAALLLAAAVVAPAVLWLSPALLSGQAPVFRDQADFFFPLKLWTADRLKSGDVPLWNPLSGGGEPWLANGQSGPFYPPTWLFLLPSPAMAAGLFVLLHICLGAAGTWRFLAAEGASVAARAFGAAVFAGCGYAASLAAFWNHFGGWCWLPWVALLARSGLRTLRHVAALGLCIGLQAMAGSPEMSMLTLALAAGLAAFARPPEPAADGWRQEEPGRPLVRLLAAAALGLLLAGWALVPMAELSASSPRRAALPGADREIGALGASAFSSAAGLPSARPASDWAHSVFLTTAVLFAAAAAFMEKERRTLVLVLAVAALAGLLLSFAGPPGSWLRAMPPLDRFRYPSKFAGLSVFAIAVLGGLGSDALRFGRVGFRAAATGGILSAAIAAMAGDSVVRAGGAAAAVALALSALPAVRESLRGLLQGAAVVAVAVAFAAAGRPLFAYVPEGNLRRVATTIPFLRGVGGRVLTPPMGDLARWALVEDRYDAGTLARQREALLGYANLLAGVPTLRTAAPLPMEMAIDAARAADAVEVPRGPAGAAGARVLWTPFLPHEMGSKKTGEFFLAPIEPWRPRVSFVARAVVERDARIAREKSLSGKSDYRHEILIDRPGPSSPAGRPGLFVASLVEDRPERVVVAVENHSAGYLVLADAWYPGWRAEVDGRRTEVFRADGMFRAVHIAPGSHRVAFVYRPVSVLIGAAVSVAAAVALALLARRRAGMSRPA